MFTGIVTALGVVARAKRSGDLLELSVTAPEVARELTAGDSVAVNGVCLTATRASRRRFSAQAMKETLDRTALGELGRGSVVNLELPARLSDRLGGHLVQGHVDGVATVVATMQEDGSRRVRLEAAPEVLEYLVPKGSVTLDGVSLTVVDVGPSSFEVALIPHTLRATNFEDVATGSLVNVEVDVLAKYVEKLLKRS
jgi:riboflavin synthase